MTVDELPGFLAMQLDGYVKQRVEFGGDEPAEAASIANRQFAEFFPDGAPAAGHFVFVGRAVDSGQRVGVLWLGERPRGADAIVWIYDIEVDDAARGHGWGRQLMQFAQTWAGGRGAARIELNVFGGNIIARTLYQSLGYRESSVHMALNLPDTSPDIAPDTSPDIAPDIAPDTSPKEESS